MKFEPYQVDRIEEARLRYGPLVSVLRNPNAYWHRTSIDGLERILRSGGIEPNDGRFPFTYSQSRLCMARDLGAVSLFDFNTRSVDEILLRSNTWGQFFSDCGPATIAIRIDATALDKEKAVLPGSLTHEDMLRTKPNGARYIPMYLPAVEAWYLGTVPVSAFEEYLVFRRHTNFYYERCKIRGGLERLCDLNKDWESAEEAEA